MELLPESIEKILNIETALIYFSFKNLDEFIQI